MIIKKSDFFKKSDFLIEYLGKDKSRIAEDQSGDSGKAKAYQVKQFLARLEQEENG